MDVRAEIATPEREEREHLPVPDEELAVPWLVYPCGKHRGNQTLCTISTSLGGVLSLGEILACSHGWLLLFRRNYGDVGVDHQYLCMWNPRTLELVKQPLLRPSDLDLVNGNYVTICTSSPKEHGSRIFILDMDRPKLVYCRPQLDQHWTVHDYRTEMRELFGEEYESTPLHGHVSCSLDGMIYAFTRDMLHMVGIEVDDNQSRLTIKSYGLRFPVCRKRTSVGRVRTLCSFGELYLVYMRFRGIYCSFEVTGIQVFKADFARMAWEEVSTLKDVSFFLGDDCSAAASCLGMHDHGIKANRIYFTLQNDPHLYTYHMEHDRISVSFFYPRPEIPWFPPTWIMPPHHRRDEHVENRPDRRSEEKILPADYVEDEGANDRCLPWDVFPMITRHLKPREYFNFRAACKFFKSVAPPCPVLEYPSLTSYRGDTSFFTLVDPEHGDTYSIPAPETLLGNLICSSKDDYLVMINDRSIVFVNPFTGVQSQLPNSPVNLTGPRLSSPPSSDCVVAEICYGYICSITPGEDEWHRKDFAIDFENPFLPNNSSMVTYKGMFYVLSETRDLGVSKFDGIDWTWEVLPGLKLHLPYYTFSFSYSYLAECDGELIAVVVGRHGYGVQLYKVDFTCMSWVTVTSLGNYMLFVSNSSSFSAIAKSPRMANKVYFPRLHDGHIVFYSLETGQFHTHGRQEAILNFSDTEEQLNCAWIQQKGF